MKTKVAKKDAKTRESGTKETEILKKSASKSSSSAIRESKALGLSVKSISGNKIIEKSPSGKIKILREIKKKSISGKRLKKGMVLCRK